MRKLDYVNFVILLALAVGIIVFVRINTTRVAYVRSKELIYEYAGTKEAMGKFNERKQGLLANADTLKAELQHQITAFKQKYSTLTPSEIKDINEQLSRKQAQVTKYAQAINDKIASQDEEMMQAVLNQVNSYAEEYGKANGYDIIIGTTSSGNVLYGKESLDITDELLEALNKKYRGE